MNDLKHIAFIMDGNGRWAKLRNKPRTFGHKHGLRTMKEIINSCLKLNIECVSFFAFSTENWNRPHDEVNYLLKLLKTEMLSDRIKQWFIDNNVRFIWNGFEDNIEKDILLAIRKLELLTEKNSKMTIQIMFNYGSRQKIISVCKTIIENNLSMDIENFSKINNPHNLPDLDLVIRTSGENRISNFMLWELSYSEIIFNNTLWPDYNNKSLLEDIENYNKRVRRFGRI